jgi:septum formation protein
MTILLTSDSIRRKALLQQAGFRDSIDFEMAGMPVDFHYHNKEERLTLAQVKEKVVEVARLQIRQAQEQRTLHNRGLSPKQALLVGAETVLFHDGRVLQRPLSIDPLEATPEEIREAEALARPVLQAIRGKEITVLTGLVVAQGDAPANQRSTCVATRVKMKRYSENDIEAYIATGEGLTMAGGFDLQEQGVVLSEKIKGSFSNIGGLPLPELIELLRDPLFAGRIRFRLSEPDKGKYSVAVKEGPPRLKIVSLDDTALESNSAWPEIDQFDVLHVPGRHLIDETEREITWQLMKRAKRAGKLVVLDTSGGVEKALGRQTFLSLVSNKVDVLLEKELTVHRLSKLMSPRLLLASQSPRRRELLKQIVAGNMIEVLVSQQAEPYLDEKPEVRVKRLALEKARTVLRRKKTYSPSIKIVIGADTEVVLDGAALGKPAGDAEAREQLRRLQGRTHQVITGLALISAQNAHDFVDVVSTLVKFKELTGAEIETYIDSGEPKGKAGAYGIQSKGALFVGEINGSYSNVVGLPLERLSEILDQEFGLPVWQLDAVFGRHFTP